MAPKSHHLAVLSALFGLALALTSVFGTKAAQASTCAQSSYTLNTQSSVDVLGNTGCTAVLGNLTITGSGITSLATLSNITSIGGDLNVNSNTNLASLAGLDGLTSVTGAVTVLLNGSLSHLCGLQNVTTIGGDLTVANNSGSSALNCTWSLQTVGGNIAFESNSWTYQLDYLRSLTNHSGSLVIRDTPGLLYFSTEQPYELVSVGGDLVLWENNGIIGFAELLNLVSVGGDLTISSNPDLDTLDGLDNLNSVGGNLTVELNPTLGDCLAFIPLLGFPNGPDSVGGTVTIASNQSGCNSVENLFATVQPPGQPTITGITAGDGQITLTASITSEGTFPVTGFRGVCTDSQNNSSMSTGTGSSVTVTGLTNGTAYTCTVVALSDGGESQPSGESIPKTPEEKPQIDPAVLWFLIKGSPYIEEDILDIDPGLFECPLYTESVYAQVYLCNGFVDFSRWRMEPGFVFSFRYDGRSMDFTSRTLGTAYVLGVWTSSTPGGDRSSRSHLSQSGNISIVNWAGEYINFAMFKKVDWDGVSPLASPVLQSQDDGYTLVAVAADSPTQGEPEEPTPEDPEAPPFSPSPDSGGGDTAPSNADDCVVTTWNSCGESDGAEGTSGSDSPNTDSSSDGVATSASSCFSSSSIKCSDVSYGTLEDVAEGNRLIIIPRDKTLVTSLTVAERDQGIVSWVPTSSPWDESASLSVYFSATPGGTELGADSDCLRKGSYEGSLRYTTLRAGLGCFLDANQQYYVNWAVCKNGDAYCTNASALPPAGETRLYTKSG